MKLSLKSREGAMGSKSKSKKEFDKYWYYRNSVQSPEEDVKFFRNTYKELKNDKPTTFREDFCGTFALSCEWVKLKSHHEAFGVDLDPEPIQYGMENYYPRLKAEEQNRVNIQENNVLAKDLPTADIVAACNFSYFCFKKREVLREYFKNVHGALNDNGILIADIFGGSQCYEPQEEETEHDTFSYFWDQDKWDPVSNEGLFHIHFKPKGKKKIRNAFTYDWRMWSIPEVREIMEEAGFTKTHVYWEGTDDDGEGDGEFKRVTEGEDCESWIAYIVGEK